MFVRTFFLALALIAFPLIVAAADGRPDNEAAVDDAFAISMYNPHFVAAAKAGKAHDMRVILVGNGAPTDFRLTAQGMSVEARIALTRELDDRVAAVAGTGFAITPFARADALSDELGLKLR